MSFFTAPARIQTKDGSFPSTADFVIHDDEYMTIIWDAAQAQPKYFPKATAPDGAYSAWHDTHIFKLDGGNSTTDRDRGNDNFGNEQFFFFSDNPPIANFDMESWASKIICTVCEESDLTGRAPAYRLELLGGWIGFGSIYYTIEKFNRRP